MLAAAAVDASASAPPDGGGIGGGCSEGKLEQPSAVGAAGAEPPTPRRKRRGAGGRRPTSSPSRGRPSVEHPGRLVRGAARVGRRGAAEEPAEGSAAQPPLASLLAARERAEHPSRALGLEVVLEAELQVALYADNDLLLRVPPPHGCELSEAMLHGVAPCVLQLDGVPPLHELDPARHRVWLYGATASHNLLHLGPSLQRDASARPPLSTARFFSAEEDDAVRHVRLLRSSEFFC